MIEIFNIHFNNARIRLKEERGIIMTQKYKTSLTLRNGLSLKNRTVMAPMTTRMSFHDGDVTKDELEYYAMRSGQLGAVITAAANVQNIGKGWEGELSAASDLHLPSLQSLANAIQINGTKAIIQLFHGGRMTNSKVLRGEQPVSASAVAAERDNAEVPRALEHDEILQVIEDFKSAVIRSYEAGFDGVELHGANTYLIQQFFSPHSNRRNDVWGGSLEKRFKFINDLVDGVLDLRKNFTRPFAIGYRFSPEEYENPGIRLEDTVYLVDNLANKELDYLHISLNEYDRVSVSEDYHDKSILKVMHDKIAGRIPLVGVGSIKTTKDLDNVMEDAELAALGRSVIADPHWVSKVFNDRDDLIRTSIALEDFDELKITRGLSGSLLNMMADQIK